MVNFTLDPRKCFYCPNVFTPKRRGVQKYCCESCKVMACRSRRNGVSGTLSDKPKTASVTDLYKKQQEMIQPLMEQMEALQERFRVLDLYVNEIMRQTNSIKLDQRPDLLRDISGIVEGWQSRGMSTVPEQVKAMKLQLLEIHLHTTNIKTKQNQQMVLTILTGLFGPQLGKKMWDNVEEMVTGKKEMPIEEKIDTIMKVVSKLNL